jgi:hypothetical protein
MVGLSALPLSVLPLSATGTLAASNCIGCPSGGSGAGHTVALVVAVVLVLAGLGLAVAGPGRGDGRLRIVGFVVAVIGLVLLFTQA